MNVHRIVIERDYPTLKKWWELRGVSAPPAVILPAVGVLAEEIDGMPVACAWLYEDKAGIVGMVEWEATNPRCSPFITLRALNHIFAFFEEYWCNAPGRVLFSWTQEGRGDGRMLRGRHWIKCPGERHELMLFQGQPSEAPCRP